MTQHLHTLPYTLNIGELGEVEVELHFTYSPGTPDVMYMSNGDPGYPGNPAEYEIVKVTYQGFDVSNWFDCASTLNDSQYICNAIGEWASEEDASAAADYAEQLHEERMYENCY